MHAADVKTRLLPLDEVILETLRAAHEPLDHAQVADRARLWLATTPVERSSSLCRLVRAGLVRTVSLPTRQWHFPLLEGSPRMGYEAIGRESDHAGN